MDKQTFAPNIQYDLPVDVAIALHKRKLVELEVLKRLRPVVDTKAQVVQHRLNDAHRTNEVVIMEELKTRKQELGELDWHLGRLIDSTEVESESLRLLIEVTKEMETGKETV